MYNKKFLKTKFNQDKNNYRSPYSFLYYPDNLRSYMSTNLQTLETMFNNFL